MNEQDYAEFPSPLWGVRGIARTSKARNFARTLRKKTTNAERSLWRLLRGRHFEGFKFRRQSPCGIYFLDFHCIEAKLAIELDGSGHGFPDQRMHDEERDLYLKSKGIKVLRFWNHQLRGELEAVRFEIWHALMERTGQTHTLQNLKPLPATPSPRPSPPTGERETKRSTHPSS